ncbi:uncharacterized protein A4U43_C02F20470 [Asparagus officinalis]|uniref:J domain-containing protein n=3 Tax=Asparagus officinalis TaxID=4686 RepID=A0A5P1FJW7_ASPOF|nr:uncharacterized protein A4U43_C02F20470 [Asparagus officinalis]
MECNKEEALRAKEIAEKKMQLKDFLGAKKVALKAQQLFSDLDNISQMITVCEVHCRAGLKVNGEMDWYGVLQLEQTADESSIKKQYRKLALLLHPDKNKFAGAEAAFKLIGEANMILSDRAKRSVYDMKRRANITTAVSKQPAQNANMTTFPRKQPAVQHNFTSTATFHFGNINQQQSVGSQTFWTMCSACCMKFQYFRNLLNRSIRCNRCLQPFVAMELNEQSVPRPWESSNLHSHTQNSKQEVPFQGSTFGNFSFATGFQGNVAGGSSSGVNMDRCGKKEDGNKVKPEKVNTAKAGRKERPVKPSAQNSRKKKGRKMVIESSDSESSTDLEYEAAEDSVHVEEQNIGTSNGRYPRRSSRVKQDVTYNERQIDDDDDFVSPKRLRKAGASGGIHNNANDDRRKSASEENLPNGDEPVKKYKVHETEQEPNVTSEPVASSNVRSFSSPDSEFYDFEQERDPSKFAADQIWAVYDDLDAMPRFYARIRQVFTPFRLRFTWLEYVPFREHESEWYSAELPVACGKYRHGKLESTTTVEMFSHQVSWKSGGGANRNTYDMYPHKGEIWALFKGWDAGWISDANSHRLYEYEVIEVLSDLSDGNDFYVVDLVKVQGSVSLFMRSVVNGKRRILRSEVLRFSHRIPSYRLSGGEREGVPEGSFELDTASLPNNFGDVFPSVSPDTASVKAMSMKLNEENDMETRGSKGVSADALNRDSPNED